MGVKLAKKEKKDKKDFTKEKKPKKEKKDKKKDEKKDKKDKERHEKDKAKAHVNGDVKISDARSSSPPKRLGRVLSFSAKEKKDSAERAHTDRPMTRQMSQVR